MTPRDVTPTLDVSNPDSAKRVGLELATDAQSFAARLADCTIRTVQDLEQAVLDRQAIGEFRARVVAYFKPTKALAYQLHRNLCSNESDILTPLEALDRQKAAAIATFKASQDRVRQEAERAEQLRRQQELQTAAAHEAAALEASGEHELAAVVIEDAIAAPPPVVALPDTTRAVAGLKFVRRWKWKFAGGPPNVDQTPPEILARCMNQIPLEFLMLDTVKVGAYVRSMKSSGAIPGITIYHVDEPVR